MDGVRTYLVNDVNYITRDWHASTSLWIPNESQVESYEDRDNSYVH